MCGNDGVNHVIAQCVNHVSLDKIAAATPVTSNGKRNVAAMIHRHTA